jgi:uncharacterized membrane protein
MADIDENQPGEKKGSGLDRLALWITERVSSMLFFVLIFFWTFGWLAWNMFAPKAWRFDPFPGFVLWLFLSNMIQLLLMPLIMIGQNLQNREADQRAKCDYEVNHKAELEVQEIQARLKCIMEHLGIEPSSEAKRIAAKVAAHPEPTPLVEKEEKSD